MKRPDCLSEQHHACTGLGCTCLCHDDAATAAERLEIELLHTYRAGAEFYKVTLPIRAANILRKTGTTG